MLVTTLLAIVVSEGLLGLMRERDKKGETVRRPIREFVSLLQIGSF
ncbi:MAG: hypothetical protein KatS3mg071_0018 [Meiothermus sp.]|nr:MAG: hypothetical protein KatS3mg071_0018 [Meiothermus sp.]